MVRIALFFSFLLVSLAAQATPLRIGVSETILSLPLFIAEAEGFFQKRGVSVEFVQCVGGNRCVKNMLDGQSDLATATELPVVFNSFTRNDFAILTSFVSVSNDVKVVARTESKITEPGKLRDKTLGYVKGGARQYVLDLVLVYNGIDPNTVKLKAITPETALAALANKEVDALSIWEPFASRIELELGADVQLVPIPKLYTETFNLIGMQRAIKNRPQELERVVHALKDSTQFIQTHPERARALAARRLNVPVVLIDKIFDDYRFRLSLNRSLLRTMEGQARWAVREGHVNANLPQPNYSNYLYPAFLKAVDSGAVSLQ
ncbi:MAG: ABC transporter substrate-binding protein [Burkholderiales bacterium]|jgi:ABC-type nitrate/sulfonate/bicarbonate transport system substrate-binding protein|uniref:ABC transporter substrate-binding protein n=1 Tax=Limnobacter sp. TaxID=2003368 RepID=UPI003934464A|nr:ABC transporter substrate-binding protein [Burkholderiales bacterium]